MSEHDSHDDANLSALYRRTAREEPSPQLDARVLAMAKRHARHRAHRWWLPLSTAAVVVLAVGLLLRHQQHPDELSPQVVLDLSEQSAAKRAAPAAPAELSKAQAESRPNAQPVVPAEPAKKPAERSFAKPKPSAAASPAAEAEKLQTPPEGAGNVIEAPSPKELQSEPSAAAPLAGATASVQQKSAKRSADSMEEQSANAPATLGAEPKAKREVPQEAPEDWLKRIEALHAKGDIEAAKRELTAFRKVYPHYVLPKALQGLLPEPAK